MAPEWWFQMMEAAEATHDPDLHQGREWDQLEAEEQEALAYDCLTEMVDRAE